MPILPPSLENFLDAPVPYIMGLLRPTVDVELYKRGTVGILDIDNGMYTLCIQKSFIFCDIFLYTQPFTQGEFFRGVTISKYLTNLYTFSWIFAHCVAHN